MKNSYILLLLAGLIPLFAVNHLQATSLRMTAEQVSTQIRKSLPGDTLLIANGAYRDIRMAVQGKGEPDKPIVVRAETPGGVVLEGESNLRLAGEWIIVEGLYFRNGYSPTGTVIEYRQGTRHAYNCRVTGCVIDSFNPASRQVKGNWVQLYGQNNRFDHNSVVGKLNEGVTLTAVLDHVENQHHRIDNNYFGPRPVCGSNGAETIRTGNSFTSKTPSFIVIEDNYFDRCSGEVETLSIKSSDNSIRRNTFFECEGGVALRHGDRNVVESNRMIGNGKPNTGGIRIINKGHRIINNYLSGLVGRRAFAPLAVMNGVPNSPEYRYDQVTDTEISGNVLEECTEILFCLGKDFERTQTPLRVTFSRNQIIAPCDENLYTAFDTIAGITFTDNTVFAKKHLDLPTGFASLRQVKIKDMTAAMTRERAGASWYRHVEPQRLSASGRSVDVMPGDNTLLKAVAESRPGDELVLAGAGEYWSDAPVVIPHFLRIRAAEGLVAKPELRYCGKGGEPMVVVADGGHLEVVGVAFNGLPKEPLRDPKGFINTAATMIHDYTLTVVDCDFSRFNRSGTYAITCSQGSFAQTIRIRNSRFFDLPWDAIVLTRETDFYGRYNVENLEVSNCSFANIGGRAIDLSRLGYDESTAGPHAKITHCSFYNVFNREQGSVIDLSGVQKVLVADCTFEKSGQGGASIRLNEMRWDEIEISRCNVYQSGRIASFWGRGVAADMLRVDPAHVDPRNNNLRLAATSPLVDKATDGTNIGIN